MKPHSHMSIEGTASRIIDTNQNSLLLASAWLRPRAVSRSTGSVNCVSSA